MRLAVRLAPCSYGASLPRDLVIQPHGEGLRLFASDGVCAVIIDCAGHCAATVALGSREVEKLLQRHADADLFTVSPAAEGDWSWRVRTFSPSMTAAIQVRRGDGIAAEAIERILAISEEGTGGEGGTWSVLALRPVAKLLSGKHALDRVNITMAGTDGPLVVNFASRSGWSGRLVTMRCKAAVVS